MKPLDQLHNAGQSVWLDNIRRAWLKNGDLAAYIKDYAVTGLTSNPTIFERDISGSADYDQAIIDRLPRQLAAEALFQELAIEDLQQAADLFEPVFQASGGTDGFVSLEVSPRLAGDTNATIVEARQLHLTAARENLLIKVPGTTAGLIAFEALIAGGVPINITLLFSAEQYRATAEAYLRGIERRVKADLDPNVASVASLFISRWDVKSKPQLPADLQNRLGIAIAVKAYAAYQQSLQTDRWRSLEAAGAKPQKLLLASTGTKDPELDDTYYISALTFEGTINTMPDKTLLAFADHGAIDTSRSTLADADRVLNACAKEGVDLQRMAHELQIEGRDNFNDSFDQLLRCLQDKTTQLAAAHARSS